MFRLVCRVLYELQEYSPWQAGLQSKAICRPPMKQPCPLQHPVMNVSGGLQWFLCVRSLHRDVSSDQCVGGVLWVGHNIARPPGCGRLFSQTPGSTALRPSWTDHRTQSPTKNKTKQNRLNLNKIDTQVNIVENVWLFTAARNVLASTGSNKGSRLWCFILDFLLSFLPTFQHGASSDL